MTIDDKEKCQLEELYNFIGNYIVFFQCIESNFNQTLNYLLKPKPKEFLNLVALTNRQKIELIRKLIKDATSKDSEDFFDRVWIYRFEKTMANCKNEADYRNSLVHSDFPYAGEYAQPAFRIGTKGKKGDRVNDFETLDKAVKEKHLMRVAKLVLKTHWIKARCQNYKCGNMAFNNIHDNLEHYLESIIEQTETGN